METTIMGYMGGCQNYGSFLGPYCNTAPNIQGTQKGSIILTTTHMFSCLFEGLGLKVLLCQKIQGF